MDTLAGQMNHASCADAWSSRDYPVLRSNGVGAVEAGGAPTPARIAPREGGGEREWQAGGHPDGWGRKSLTALELRFQGVRATSPRSGRLARAPLALRVSPQRKNGSCFVHGPRPNTSKHFRAKQARPELTSALLTRPRQKPLSPTGPEPRSGKQAPARRTRTPRWSAAGSTPGPTLPAPAAPPRAFPRERSP
jgi:hypothetical protein